MRPPDETPPWQHEAACRGADANLFFPTKAPGLFGPGPPNHGTAAKHICSRCPVAKACMAAAITHHERDGIWAGAGDRTRQRLARLTRTQSPDAHPPRCRCEYCVSVSEHLDQLRRAFDAHGPAHGRWEAYIHAGCRCAPCTKAYARSGRTRAR